MANRPLSAQDEHSTDFKGTCKTFAGIALILGKEKRAFKNISDAYPRKWAKRKRLPINNGTWRYIGCKSWVTRISSSHAPSVGASGACTFAQSFHTCAGRGSMLKYNCLRHSNTRLSAMFWVGKRQISSDAVSKSEELYFFTSPSHYYPISLCSSEPIKHFCNLNSTFIHALGMIDIHCLKCMITDFQCITRAIFIFTKQMYTKKI